MRTENLFDGRPEWFTQYVPKVEFNIREVGLGSQENFSFAQKTWKKQQAVIKFNKDEKESWMKGMMDAVKQFISQESVLENRVKLIEVSYPDRSNYGEVMVECYIQERKIK